MSDEFIYEPRVTYFSMEIPLRKEIPTYAGGLGVLGSLAASHGEIAVTLLGLYILEKIIRWRG